jgi:hypothetical protein
MWLDMTASEPVEPRGGQTLHAFYEYLYRVLHRLDTLFSDGTRSSVGRSFSFLPIMTKVLRVGQELFRSLLEPLGPPSPGLIASVAEIQREVTSHSVTGSLSLKDRN